MKELLVASIEQTAENEVIVRVTQGYFTISGKRSVKNEDEIFELFQRITAFNEKERKRFEKAAQ
jgi:hypothetical protein